MDHLLSKEKKASYIVLRDLKVSQTNIFGGNGPIAQLVRAHA